MVRMKLFSLAFIAGAAGGLIFGKPVEHTYQPFAYVVKQPAPESSLAQAGVSDTPSDRPVQASSSSKPLKSASAAQASKKASKHSQKGATPMHDASGADSEEAAVANFICRTYGGDCNEIEGLVELVGDTAEAHGIPAEIAWAIAIQESRFKPHAVNRASGDYGLMQVNYRWHKDKVASPRELLDPRTNVSVAMRILGSYAKMEKGNWYRTFRRYNGLGGKNNYPSEVLARVERLREVQRSVTSNS